MSKMDRKNKKRLTETNKKTINKLLLSKNLNAAIASHI